MWYFVLWKKKTILTQKKVEKTFIFKRFFLLPKTIDRCWGGLNLICLYFFVWGCDGDVGVRHKCDPVMIIWSWITLVALFWLFSTVCFYMWSRDGDGMLGGQIHVWPSDNDLEPPLNFSIVSIGQVIGGPRPSQAGLPSWQFVHIHLFWAGNVFICIFSKLAI